MKCYLEVKAQCGGKYWWAIKIAERGKPAIWLRCFHPFTAFRDAATDARQRAKRLGLKIQGD